MARAWAIKIRDNELITMEDVPAFRKQEVRKILLEMGLDDFGKPLQENAIPNLDKLET